MRICKTLGEDSQGFARLWEGFTRLWERIREDLQDFGRGFTRIRKTLGGIHETLGEGSQGFVRLWERICKTLGEDL